MNNFFNFIIVILLLSSCSNRTLNYKVTGTTENAKYANFAYLYLDEDNAIADCNSSRPVLSNSETYKVYKCTLVNNSFSFKGKTAKSIINPLNGAYLFLDTIANFSSEKLLQRIRSDRKLILLDDRKININVSNNLRVTDAVFKKGKLNIAFDELNSFPIERYSDENCQNFIAIIKKHSNSVCSLYFLNAKTNSLMPLKYIEKGLQSLSPKLKKTPTYLYIQKNIIKLDQQKTFDGYLIK